MAAVGQHQPDRVQLFVQDLGQRAGNFLRQDPTLTIVAAVALAILGSAALVSLPILFPGVALLVTVADIGVVAIGIVEGMMIFSVEEELENSHRICLLIGTVALTALGLGLPALLSGVVATALVEQAAFYTLISHGILATLLLSYFPAERWLEARLA